MAGNAVTQLGKPAASAMEELSKNDLIDLVACLARKQLTQMASDREILELVERSLMPVLAVRGKKWKSLTAHAERVLSNFTAWATEQGLTFQSNPSRLHWFCDRNQVKQEISA